MARVASEKRPSRYKEQAQGLVKDIAWREEDGIVLIDQDRCRGRRLLRYRLPVQVAPLQLGQWQDGEVSTVLSPRRGRQRARVLPLLPRYDMDPRFRRNDGFLIVAHPALPQSTKRDPHWRGGLPPNSPRASGGPSICPRETKSVGCSRCPAKEQLLRRSRVAA